MPKSEVILKNKNGLYVPDADVYIDPWRPVKTALITHAHADHARYGHDLYIATQPTIDIMKHRISDSLICEARSYRQPFKVNSIIFEFIPAGHILGSAQIVIHHPKKKVIVTGDYKCIDDGICTPIEYETCDLLISECTFGLPIFSWKDEAETFKELKQAILNSHKRNQNCVIYTYALGKAQRVLNYLNQQFKHIYVHTAVDNMNKIHEKYGLKLENVKRVSKEDTSYENQPSIIVAPPSSAGSPWEKKFKPYEQFYVSGWMHIRGNQRRRNMKGVVLSDHACWGELISTIQKTKAKEVWLTHGYQDELAKYLSELGIKAIALDTQYEGEQLQ